MRKSLFSLLLVMMVAAYCLPVMASDEGAATVQQAGGTEADINNAASEETKNETITGAMIEIGNTTADNTTIVIRTKDAAGNSVDQTVEIAKSTRIFNGASLKSFLDDWIAGDQIVAIGIRNVNSGEFIASRVTNRTMQRDHKGINGWIKEIKTEENQVLVTYADKTFTLDMDGSRIVAGLVNPAAVNDLKIGDRIRARVADDGDGDKNTWNSRVMVVLRRGSTLFMRVTRWVVPAKIVALPDDTSARPFDMTVEILPNRFFQTGDANNLIGAPGDQLVITVNDHTHLMRRFRGKCLADEFTEGDEVNIIGRLDFDSDKLEAIVIKNNSIQKLGVWQMRGQVLSVDSESRSLNMQLIRNLAKEYAIKAGADTKIFRRSADGLVEIDFSQIKTGDSIRARGTYNKRLKVVNASKIVILPAIAAELPESPECNSCSNQ